MRIASVLTLVSAGMFAAACSSPAEHPTAPTRVLVVTEMRGLVKDTAFRTLADVKVEIVNGPNAGAFAISDQSGQFSFAGSFSGLVMFRATKEAYLPATQSVDVQTLYGRYNARIAFGMESPDTILRLEPGDYTLTFIADPSCTRLPPELRARTYAATVTHSSGDYPGGYNVDVPEMLFGQSGFLLGISGNYLATEDGGYPTLFEAVPPNTYLGIDFLIGTTTFEIKGASEISIPFPGTFEYCSVTPGVAPQFCDFFPATSLIARERCYAAHHQIALVRR